MWAGLVVGWCVLGCLVVAVPLVVLALGPVLVVRWVLGDVKPPFIEVAPVEGGMFVHGAGGRPSRPPVPALRMEGPGKWERGGKAPRWVETGRRWAK